MCGTNSGRCFLNEDVLCGLSTVRYLSCDRIYKVVLDMCASSLFLFPWDEMTRASNEQRDHQTLVNRFPYHTIHTHSYIDLYLTTSTVTHIHTSNSLIAKGKRKIQTWLLDHHTTGKPTHLSIEYRVARLVQDLTPVPLYHLPVLHRYLTVFSPEGRVSYRSLLDQLPN